MEYYVNITLSLVFRFFKTNFKKWVCFRLEVLGTFTKGPVIVISCF